MRKVGEIKLVEVGQKKLVKKKWSKKVSEVGRKKLVKKKLVKLVGKS